MFVAGRVLVVGMLVLGMLVFGMLVFGMLVLNAVGESSTLAGLVRVAQVQSRQKRVFFTQGCITLSL